MQRAVGSTCSVLLLFFLFSTVLWAQSSPCDSSLKPAPNHPNQYKVQDNDPVRCEGMYTNRVAGTGSILLVALLKGTRQVDPQTGSVAASWQPLVKAETRLRSYSLRDQIYFRMDARLPPSTGSYVWSTAIPKSAGLTSGEVGLVAWTSTVLRNETREVYLPLTISQEGPGSPLMASFWAPMALSKVTLTISPADAPNARPLAPMVKPGQYPPRRRIDFVLDSLPRAGFYELTISGEDAARQPWTDSYLIYRP